MRISPATAERGSIALVCRRVLLCRIELKFPQAYMNSSRPGSKSAPINRSTAAPAPRTTMSLPQTSILCERCFCRISEGKDPIWCVQRTVLEGLMAWKLAEFPRSYPLEGAICCEPCRSMLLDNIDGKFDAIIARHRRREIAYPSV